MIWLKNFWLNERIAFWFVGIALLAAGFRLFFFISIYAVDVPFTDQWHYFSTLWNKGSLISQFFFQLGPHRMGLEFLISSFVLGVTGWNIKALAFLGGVYLFLAAIVALYLKRQVVGKITIFDIFIPFLVMSLAQHGILVTDPFPGYAPFPLLLLFLYCLSWQIEEVWKKYVAVVSLNFLLLFGSFGLVVTPLTVLLLISEWFKPAKGENVMWLKLSLLAVLLSLIGFFWNYKFNASVACFRFPDTLGNYLVYISAMFANAFAIVRYINPLWATIVGFTSFLATLYLATRSFLRFKTKHQFADRVLFILFSYSSFFAVLTAIGRSCLGPDQAQSSRYFAYLIPTILGVYMMLVKIHLSRLSVLLVVVFTFVIMRSELLTYVQDKQTIEDFAFGKRVWVDCYLKYEDISLCSDKLDFFLHPSRWEWVGDPNTEFGFAYLKYNNYSFFRLPK